MKRSWTECWSKFKSPLRIVVQCLLRSRRAWAKKYQEQKEILQQARRRVKQWQTELELQRQEISRLKVQVQRLEIEKQTAQRTACRLPDDPPVGLHGYGSRTVSLSVNLARDVGLRGSEKAMQTMFNWLGVEQKIPRHTSIRGWLCRIGVAALEEPVEKADDWIWLADHSNQIGPEKVLVVLGVRASQLPLQDQALRYQDMRVLAVRPGTSWKREDVGAVYAQLAQQSGTPRAVLTDGAVELRDAVDWLKTDWAEPIVLQDFKHKAANLLKALLKKDQQFAEFHKRLSQTRSAIQQTELAHLTPPGQKPKARFMNLGSFVRWGAAMLRLLEHPQRPSRCWVTAERLEEKLGWIRSFGDDLPRWQECQRVLGAGLKFINEQGIFQGATKQLQAVMAGGLTHEISRTLAVRLLRFVGQAERQLRPDERLPLSTEVLESALGRFKQLERQHAKGGFTSLLAVFAALLQEITPETIKRSFSRVSDKDVQAWVRDNLGETLTSKRTATYRDFKQHPQGATKLSAAS